MEATTSGKELESVNTPEDFMDAMDMAQMFEFNVSQKEFEERWESAQGSSATSEHLAARFAKSGLLDTYGRGDTQTRATICKMLARFYVEQVQTAKRLVAKGVV
jgi:hypothetical protein